ncbi:hypothetical protein DH2020_019383 [Rehmannia glutinosa]|uniref:Pectinesterase catalytic domain-containing protein n=1 Tax=Rehmannia glutinosa TaxID=99300 RepID=A0ABR0WPC0_REHGL
MDEVNVSQSALPSTSGSASNLVSNETNEPSCIDIEVDVEMSPIHSLAPPPSVPISPFPISPFLSRASTDIEGFDSQNYVSAQLSPLLAFSPSENSVQHRINWITVIKVLVGVTLIVTIGLLSTLYFITKRGQTNFGCKINFIVSKDGKSNFTTVSEAVNASPSYSPYKVCIFIRTGEYQEMVKIGEEKINLVLMGEGIGKTVISSNASTHRPITTWPLATLRINGKEFLAQDLTIINTAKYGVAVENRAENSILFRCKLEGVNATLHVKGRYQVYRSCHLYGKSNLVFGCAHAFFQKCEFFSEKSYPEEKIIFSSQSSPLSTYKNVFIFHLCAFHVANKFINSSETTFLGCSFGNASIVVMQSNLDASIDGYFLDTSPTNYPYYAIFGNMIHGATMKKVPPFIHALSDVEAASKFSLRVFLGGGNWIPPGVDYDLDLNK